MSRWASYIGMISEVSGESSDYIWNEMPIARGEQFRTIWFAKNGIECVRANAPSALRKVL